jgi:hypothetical protein
MDFPGKPDGITDELTPTATRNVRLAILALARPIEHPNRRTADIFLKNL